MSKVIVVPLEKVNSRYTFYWLDRIPEMLRSNGIESESVIPTEYISPPPPEGSFLNFSFSSKFKTEQYQIIMKGFTDGILKNGDVFLFTDAWNPLIVNLKYFLELEGYDKCKILSIWHAGSYDPNDILGQRVLDKRWSYNFERSVYEACDMNFFATEYHRNLFDDGLYDGIPDKTKSVVCGFPFEYIKDVVVNSEERDLFTFPHRISSEKNIDLYEDICRIGRFNREVCQEKQLSKADYYSILGRSKYIFSGNKQETLGIGVFEGMISGAIPIVPDKLSYTEMYPSKYRYDPNLSASEIVDFINNIEVSNKQLKIDAEEVYNKFFNGERMYKIIKKIVEEHNV